MSGSWRGLIPLYVTTSVVLLALIGAASTIALQVGWLKVDLGQRYLGRTASPDDTTILSKVTGQRGYFSDFIPVDAGRVYRLSGFFRTFSQEAGLKAASYIYFGVRLYDRDRKPILGSDGAYRYPAGNGVTLTALDGWVKIEGEITGVSKQGQNSFKPGTAWIRIIVVPSYGTKDQVTEVAGIEFAERIRNIQYSQEYFEY